jgi:hypothetical protein
MFISLHFDTSHSLPLQNHRPQKRIRLLPVVSADVWYPPGLVLSDLPVDRESHVGAMVTSALALSLGIVDTFFYLTTRLLMDIMKKKDGSQSRTSLNRRLQQYNSTV